MVVFLLVHAPFGATGEIFEKTPPRTNPGGLRDDRRLLPSRMRDAGISA
jgi:hypothetical protein